MEKKKKIIIAILTGTIIIAGLVGAFAWSMGKKADSPNQDMQANNASLSQSAAPSQSPASTPTEPVDEMDPQEQEGMALMAQAGQASTPAEKEQKMQQAAEKLLGKDFKLEKITEEQMKNMQDELDGLNTQYATLQEKYKSAKNDTEKESIKKEMKKIERQQMEYVVQIMYNAL